MSIGSFVSSYFLANGMRKFWIFSLVALVLGSSYYICCSHAEAPLRQVSVLVELFTSEGCSDCPPADQVLAQLAQRDLIDGVDVIAMSEHVDYWNRLGWSDPYSDAQFSIRQNEYAQAFGYRDIYTPQMVVDGQIEFVGSNRAKAIQAITSAGRKSKDSVAITLIDRGKDTLKLQVRADPLSGLTPRESADVFLAVTENNLFSNVERGENRGRRLTHIAIVRKFIPIGNISEGSSFTALPVVRVASQWKPKDLRAVALVQGRRDRRILAVASIPLEPSE